MVEPRTFGLARVASRLLIAGVVALCVMPAFPVSAARPPNLWRGLRNLFWPTPRELPPKFPEPGVIKGAAEFDKSVSLAVPEVGTVTHITLKPYPDARLGIAGAGGAVFVSAAGEVKSRVSFSSKVTIVEFVDVEKDGVWEFLNRGGKGWNDASLLDHDGRRLWKFGEKHVLRANALAVDDMAAGDLDGDGVLDFVVGLNGSDGLRRLDKDGQVVWQQPDGNVWHVEIMDAKGDGTMEIVHSNSGGTMTVRDPNGKVLRRSKPGSDFLTFSVCNWPTPKDRPHLLTAGKGVISLYDLEGTAVATLEAPPSAVLDSAHGTAVRFKTGQPAYFAVIADCFNGRGSWLYLYNQDLELVYQEMIGDSCQSLAAVPRDDSDTEDLLVGGIGKVWKYTAAK